MDNNLMERTDIVCEFINDIVQYDTPFVQSIICMMMEELAKKEDIDVVEMAYELANTVRAVNKTYGKY